MYAVIFLCEKTLTERVHLFVCLDGKAAEIEVASGCGQAVLRHVFRVIGVRYANAQGKVLEIFMRGIFDPRIAFLGVDDRWRD